jgi:L-ascorbate metabolism protein UlaG (beta-lactamase superfamily)
VPSEPRRRRPLILVACVALALLLAGQAATSCFSAPRYQGPVSDHFDGHSFRNLGPYEARGFGDLLRWKTTGDPVPWPDWVELPPAPAPPARVTEGVRVTVVNHATCLVQMGGINVVTDPVWSKRVGPVSWIGPKRHKAPGVAFEALPKIDAILVSHNHYDHLDLPTMKRLVERDDPVVLVGLGTRKLLEKHGIDVSRVFDLDWWQSRDVGGVRITFAPAQHWSTRFIGDRFANLWGSFFVAHGDRSVYFAGDTGAGPHFRLVRERLGRPTIALLPIGAYEPRWFMRPQHIDPAEAVAAHLELGAGRSVGMHFGTFDQADEGMDDPPAALRAARASAGLAPEAFLALENGGSVVVP